MLKLMTKASIPRGIRSVRIYCLQDLITHGRDYDSQFIEQRYRAQWQVAICIGFKRKVDSQQATPLRRPGNKFAQFYADIQVCEVGGSEPQDLSPRRWHVGYH
jgi:hypothetical protein